MRHEFVEHIPECLEPHVLYVSMEFDTAVHSCACGCGHEIVTPLSPAQWSLTYDGQVVSLSPSIGNWNYPCKSHYWIHRGRIEWGARFSDDRIEAVKARDRTDLEGFHVGKRVPLAVPERVEAPTDIQIEQPRRQGLFAKLRNFFEFRGRNT